MACRGDGVRPPPCSSSTRLGWWQRRGGGAWEGFPNQPDRVKFLHIPQSQQPGEPLLSTPFEAGVFLGLSAWYLFPLLRSTQTSGWLGWALGH